MKITALITSHNRRPLTVRAVASFMTAVNVVGCDYEVVLVDDGSSDGTVEAIRALNLDNLVVERGDGSWFWAKSMARAEMLALRDDPDYLLWLNDDVELKPTALLLLLQAANGNAIAVGPVASSITGEVTYAGYEVRTGLHFRMIPLRTGLTTDRVIDAANGNVLLVRRDAADVIGGIDGTYAHAYADLDYTLRARAIGIKSVLLSSAVGTCEPNARSATHYDARIRLRERWRYAISVKGLPPRSQARFMRRHAGLLWPLHFVNSYRRVLLPSGPHVSEDPNQ